MKALTVPNSLRFGEALLSKPATVEMPATGVQSKKDISTFRKFFVRNPIFLEIQLTKDFLESRETLNGGSSYEFFKPEVLQSVYPRVPDF